MESAKWDEVLDEYNRIKDDVTITLSGKVFKYALRKAKKEVLAKVIKQLKEIDFKDLSFMEAVEAMKEGKKVRRNVWMRMDRCKGRYIEILKDFPYFRNHKGHDVTISYEEVFATDWMIVEERGNK